MKYFFLYYTDVIMRKSFLRKTLYLIVLASLQEPTRASCKTVYATK